MMMMIICFHTVDGRSHVIKLDIENSISHQAELLMRVIIQRF